MKTRYKISTLLLLCFTIITVSSSFASEKSKGYTITGTVKGVEKGWVKIIRPNIVDRSAKAVVVDSAQIKNGHFKMSGTVDYIDMVSISINEKYNTMGGFFLENSNISLTIDVEKADKYGQFEAEVSGSKSQDTFAAEKEKAQSIFNAKKYGPLVALRKEMTDAYNSKDEAKINAVKKKLASLNHLSSERQKEYQLSKINYVKNNPTSAVSSYVLSFQFSEGRMSKEEMKEIYPLFKGDATKTAMYQYFKKTYTEIFESFGEGSKVPDFTLKTLDNKDLALSSVKGKYIFVDFWASWCVPCRASFPHLKEVYAKYKKDGFNVIAVGTADQEDKWRKAIAEDETVWNHVFDVDPSGNGSYGTIAKQYGVPFLPTTFLLDENGVIIARQLRDKSLDEKLEELFGY
ncbi:AhpC/TSA family protein [Cellulophaga fucicola]|uniref:Thiol-disulfide isomerase or thioredoxin n=1 Tax=Cellulophaga fucicola TaxID=76595 RepID=A0A1K1MWW6_9FLAO|nr:AhpC/TSA family protein [Cellulophaga fucicola]SFW27477.1 Thiol-disulfide isomerase or thioredoxin [Cellulophaga fucicola]